MFDTESLRHADRRRAETLLTELLDQVEWSRDRLEAHRQRELRALLVHAVERSPFHRERLSGIDPAGFRLEDLPSLPAMTKDDLMGSFDAVAADPRITRERCEAHVASGAPYMDGEFLVFASGGTSGRRALGVAEREEAARGWSSILRFPLRWARRTRAFGAPPSMALIGAGPGPHASHVLGRIFAGPGGGPRLSVLQPLHEIVAALNAAQPDQILVYASFVPRLLEEARARRLRVRPKLLIPVAEPFLPEHEQAVAEVWACGVITSWAATETGILGGGSGFDPGMLLYDDFTIVEPVDAGGRPVSPGEPADKLLVTPLYRRALPVIRYELTDQLTVMGDAASCGTSFTRTTNVVGRLDDQFVYATGATVHPHVFRTELGRQPRISEYQVVQTEAGAEVRVVTVADIDADELSRRLAGRLERLGLPGSVVRVVRTEALERPRGSGKLQRFVPLAT